MATRLTRVQSGLYRRRKSVSGLSLGLATLAAGFGLLWLVWILGTLFVMGAGSINWSIFTEMTPAPGNQGGLLNAIFGSLAMTIVAMLVGTPIGVMAGTYLAEYGRESTLASILRFINDILLSAPSICIGIFVYEVMVVAMGHFSAWAGAVALSIIVVPVVVRTTEDILNLVPNTLREVALALGTPHWQMIVKITYRSARNGMVTGVLLAVARVAGETAPLLFTALNNQFWSANMNEPMANLPVTIFQFALSPYEDWQKLAWAGALLITIMILFLNITARFLVTVSGKHK